jgi:hypothetical protein
MEKRRVCEVNVETTEERAESGTKNPKHRIFYIFLSVHIRSLFHEIQQVGLLLGYSGLHPLTH